MIKIDIVSGFLGAGKTTFINRLLDYYLAKGERPVYIVNEFGDTGLDAAIMANSGFQSIEMANGCICCTLKETVVQTFHEIIQSYSPTRIVFEPSGVFIFNNFLEMLQSETLRYRCRIGSVITIVDSMNYTSSRVRYGNFLYSQVKNASALVISKLEKSGTAADEMICDLKNINPTAFIYAKDWQSLDERALRTIITHAVYDRTAAYKPIQPIAHEKFQTLNLPLKEELTEIQLETFLTAYRSGALGDISRIKGFFKMNGGYKLLNIAQADISVEDYKGMGNQALTFIGRKLAKEAIQKLFN